MSYRPSIELNHEGTKTQRNTKSLCSFVPLCLRGSNIPDDYNIPSALIYSNTNVLLSKINTRSLKTNCNALESTDVSISLPVFIISAAVYA